MQNNLIMRGTAPTQYFTQLPFDLDTLVALWITYSQGGEPVLEKQLEDVQLGDGVIALELTQADTLKLDAGVPVEVQLAAKTKDGKVYRSRIKTVAVERVLHDAEI